MDDFQNWERRRGNESQDFPYKFPTMPTRFRLLDRLTALFVLGEWACIGLSIPIMIVSFVLHLLGKEGIALVLGALFVLLMALYWVFRLLQHTPGLFWRCPCCKRGFPHWVPARSSRTLKGQECADRMKWERIYSHRTKHGTLLLPSECPWCRKKFYRPPQE